MRDIDRIDSILEKLGNIWKEYPDLRLGQLICNIIKDPALYYIEDEQLIELLEKEYTKINNRDDNEGYFIKEGEEQIFCYKGFKVKLFIDYYGQRFYFIFNEKKYCCGADNLNPVDEIKYVIDEYLKKKVC